MDGDQLNKDKNSGVPVSKVYGVQDSEGNIKTEDKLDNLIKKWQKETRDEIKKKGEAEFDFTSANPSSLTERVKDHTREFVEQQWASLS